MNASKGNGRAKSQVKIDRAESNSPPQKKKVTQPTKRCRHMGKRESSPSLDAHTIKSFHLPYISREGEKRKKKRKKRRKKRRRRESDA